MKNERLIGTILIAVGALALLANLSANTGWLWVGLVAAAFLAAYTSQRNYGFLVAGSILTGVAVGILLEGPFRMNGAFLISLGVGFLAIDRVEPKRSRWPLPVAAVLAALGLLTGLGRSGLLTSFWFALLLIGVGLALLSRGEEGRALRERYLSGRTEPPPPPPATEQPKADPNPTPNPTIITPPTSPTIDQPPPAPPPVAEETPKPAETSQEQAAETAPETVSSDIGPLNTGPLNTEPADADESVAARYRRLDAWRQETSAKEDKALYLILRDESLAQIARDNPQDLDALRAIKGVGPVKLERYGQAILAILKA